MGSVSPMAETSKTVNQALLVLRSLSEQGPANPTELARRLELSRTVVLRLLATLEQHGFARRSGGGFDLGFGLLEVASSIEPVLRRAARPALAALVAEWRETAVLSVRDGEDVVAVDQVVAEGRMVQVQYRVGSRHRLGEAAHGACLLAFDPATPHDGLDVVRGAGFATSRDELEPGVSGLAAPVFDGTGPAVAALGIVAPTARMPAPAELAPSVVAAADAVTEILTVDRSRTLDPAAAGR